MHGESQPVRPGDHRQGHLRIPRQAKSLFRSEPDEVCVRFRGRALRCRWNPRDEGDRHRSGVLWLGRAIVGELAIGEVVQLRLARDGCIEIE